MEAMTLYRRACELVHHEQGCQAVGGCGDEDCRCDAVPFLRDLQAHLVQPAQAVDAGKVVGYLVEKKPRVVSDAPARSFYFADQHNPTDPNWWIAGEQKKYTVTPLTRALSGEKAGPVGDGFVERPSREWYRSKIADEVDEPLLIGPLPQVFVCSNPRCDERYTSDPHGRCPKCADNGENWSVYPQPASPTPDKEGEG